MLTLKCLFEIAGLALLSFATAILLQDLCRLYHQSTLILTSQPRPGSVRPRWLVSARITAVALCILLTGIGVRIVPAGMAGIRIGQTSGTFRGTLYPGLHLVVPLVERIHLYDVRDPIWAAGTGEKSIQPSKPRRAPRSKQSTARLG